jgi:hypothetical protein
MIKKSGWFLICVLLTASCLDEPECFSLNNNIVGISFKKMSNRQEDTVYFVSITAEGSDSLFVEFDGLTRLDLPLNYFRDITDFTFTRFDQPMDLRFVYDSKAQFVSADCGERYVLSDLRASSSTFDSLRILNASPKSDNQTGTTLEVYRCPNSSAVKFRFKAPVEIAQVITYPQVPVLLIEDEEGKLSYVSVPLNADQSQSTITFTFEDGSSKEIILNYARTGRTFYRICGEQTIIHDLTVLSRTFADAIVVNDSIQDTSPTNIEITF